jgi:hypothetical protein
MKNSRKIMEYALPDAVEKFTRAGGVATPKIDPLASARDEIARNPDAHGLKILVTVSDSATAWLNSGKEMQSRRKRLQKGIESGKFIATGRRIDGGRKSADRVQIAADLFSEKAKIDWINSGISGAGLIFEIVRVSRSHGNQKYMPVPAYGDVKSANPGRPSKEAEILDIIAEIEKTGYQFNISPRNDDFEKIRVHTRQKFKAEILKGYSDPVLQRTIFRKFGRRQ